MTEENRGFVIRLSYSDHKARFVLAIRTRAIRSLSLGTALFNSALWSSRSNPQDHHFGGFDQGGGGLAGLKLHLAGRARGDDRRNVLPPD
jgi:hypothetical protein